MRKPTLHLICNAHLDPVWQWRWEEGCGETLSTFGNAVRILAEHPTLIFNHNEAVLYRWVQRYDPRLFREIQKLVEKGRWCISGGWYIQPDVNLPGLESLIRHIAEGRRFFAKHFGARPTVAYNFDSFGHSGGLPQILTQAGYGMYIHMRPQEAERHIPSDLYRWRGVDGSEILTYRLAVGLYHTERDNIERRLAEGTDLALRLQRDVPVFWGIGNHGGGATREDLEKIDAAIHRESRVRILHSTTENLYQALRSAGRQAPCVEGDLQRVFTGCYTSLSRLKRRAVASLGELVQTESLCTSVWWAGAAPNPHAQLQTPWEDHLFNDFHDILPGSCTEPAERDALDQYGRTLATARELRMGAATKLNRGHYRPLYIPVTVLNANPSCTRVPVEVECMLDLRPKWTGQWHLSLYTLDGVEIPCQEEQPESLLPFNGWRRKISFLAQLPQFGAARYEVRLVEGVREGVEHGRSHPVDEKSGLINSLDAGGRRECLAGPLLQPLVVDDDGDAWGSDRWSYRTVVGRFTPVGTTLLHAGPVRTIVESEFSWNQSTLVLKTITYPQWPVIEYRMRLHWKEHRKRLKLSIPTVFRNDGLLCEIPGGAIKRPADGQEHVHGRWCLAEGTVGGRATALGIINSGQHGLDFADGEIRLSVLRSAAYCHEQGFPLADPPSRKYMDQGVHEFRLLVTAGDAERVRCSAAGLADWLSAPPAVYAHLPIGAGGRRNGAEAARGDRTEFLSLTPQNIRLTACLPSQDGRALLLRLHESSGRATRAALNLMKPAVSIRLRFSPFAIRTIRVEPSGRWRDVHPEEE